MVLMNYVVLRDGEPTRMHFTRHELVRKTITDPQSGKSKEINTLQFELDEFQGRPQLAYYSVSSQKHAQDFATYLPHEGYRDYDFIVIATGAGWKREYTVKAIARLPR